MLYVLNHLIEWHITRQYKAYIAPEGRGHNGIERQLTFTWYNKEKVAYTLEL